MNTKNDWIDYITGIEKDFFRADDYLQENYIKIPGTKYDWFKPTKDRFKLHHTTLCGESVLIYLDTEKRQWVAAYVIGDSLLINNLKYHE